MHRMIVYSITITCNSKFAETMEPHGRDENQEDIIAGMIRGEEVIVDDVTEQFLNDSGEGEADEGEADGSGGTLNIANSGEVHIYIN